MIFHNEVKKIIEADGLKMGCWDSRLETIPEGTKVDFLNRLTVLKNIDSMDVVLHPWVFEVFITDTEFDLSVLSWQEYEAQYGREPEGGRKYE